MNKQRNPALKKSNCFENINNFRDLGGLKTRDHAIINYGRLLRSGNPGLATEDDINKLKTLKLDTIIDFRAPDEKSTEEKYFQQQFNWKAYPVAAGDMSMSSIMQKMRHMTPQESHQFMCDLYATFPTDFQSQFRQLMSLAERGQTLLFHCTAGKDRTGFAASLILSALDIHSDSIIENYLESKVNNQSWVDVILDYVEKEGIAKDTALPFLEVREEYLQSALSSIAQHFSNMDNFLTSIMKVDPLRIREHYLE